MLWVLGSGLLLIFLLAVMLQLVPVQQFLAGRVTAYLSDKLNTRVSVGRFTTDWSNSIVLKEFYLEDKQQDTLLFAGRLGLDVNVLALLKNKVILKSARLDDGMVNIRYFLPDSASNFEFIRDAFAGSSGQPADTATAFVFRLGAVNLKNVKLSVSDEARGTFVKARIGRLKTNMQQFDSEKSVYKIRKAALADSYISILKTKPSGPGSDTPMADLGFKNIAVQNLFFRYHDKVTTRKLAVHIGDSRIRADKIDTRTKKIRLRQILVSNSGFGYYHHKLLPPDPVLNPAAAAGSAVRKDLFSQLDGWDMSLKKLVLKNVEVSAGNQLTALQANMVDLNHLRFTGVNMELKDLVLNDQNFTSEIKQLQLKEKSGFRIVNSKGTVKADNRQVVLRNLNLTTGASRLQTSVTLRLPKPGPKKADPETRPFVDAEITRAIISPADVAFFAKNFAARPAYQKIKKHPFSLKGHISGQLDDLETRNVSLKGFDGTSIAFSGKIRNITTKNNKEFKVLFRQFTTTRQDLLTMLPAGTIPETLTLPETLTISGGVDSRPGTVVLKNLRIAASDGTTLVTNGTIQGEAGTERRLDLDIKKLATTRQALQKMLPKGALAPEIQLPDNIQYIGKLDGSSLKDFRSDGFFETSFGNFNLNFILQSGQRFSGSISLKDFNLGKLLKLDPALGKATGVANFNGTGYKVNTMVLHFNARIKKIVYEKETFRNIKLEGTLDKSVYAVDGNLKNIVMQGLGHTLKKLKPKNIGVRKILGRKKKDR